MSELRRNGSCVGVFPSVRVPQVPAAQACLGTLSRPPGSGPRRGEPSQRSHGDGRTQGRGTQDEPWVCQPFWRRTRHPGGGGPRRSRRPRLSGRKVILSRKEILSVPILRTAPLSGTQEFSCLFLLSYFHPVMKHINQKGSNIVFFKLLVSANWNIRFAEI